MVLTSPDMSHEPGSPNPEHQKPIGSTSDYIKLVTNKICPKSNKQEPEGSTSDCLMLLLNKIRHICTQNKITAPFITTKHKTDITQNVMVCTKNM